jgi:hypothetical protein
MGLMPPRDVSARVDGSLVRIFMGAALAGTGRVTAAGIRDYEGEPLGETRSAHEGVLSDLAVQLVQQAKEELDAMQREAYDEEGVDVSLIRWMLALSPRDRLRALDDHSRSLARLRGS